MKKLCIVTPCYSDNDEQIYKLKESCKKFNLKLTVYGLKREFRSWGQVKLKDLSEVVSDLSSEYEYILYTDGFDSWALDSEKSILFKFGLLDCDILIGGELSPFPAEAHDYEPVGKFPFLCAGTFMGKSKKLAVVLQVLNEKYYSENDQESWALFLSELPENTEFKIKIDKNADIFLNTNNLDDTEIEFFNNKLFSPLTHTHPSIIHFNGPKGGSKNEELMNKIYNKWYEL